MKEILKKVMSLAIPFALMYVVAENVKNRSALVMKLTGKA